MIPVKLTLQGIYSYQSTPQTIEFGPLLEAGNFGVFGAVGSGKSTILESISLALYGDIERLNKREDRNYNMMNLKSNRLIVDFEFQNYSGDLFRFECEGRRNSKNFRDVPTYRRKASIWKDSEWIPLDHFDGEKVTGISYQNFKRTVIVPQGHFQDFLGLSPSERSQMLQELFHLDKYDLASPTKKLKDSTSEALHRIEGQLVGYEDVNDDNIERAEIDLRRFKDQLGKESEELDRLKKQVEASNVLKRLLDLEKKQHVEYQSLKQKEDEILRARQRVKWVQEAREKFAFRFSQIDALRDSLTQMDQKIKDLSQKEVIAGRQKELATQQHQVLQKAVELHDQEMEKSRQFDLAARWCILQKEFQATQSRVDKGIKVVQNLQKDIGGKEVEIASMERDLESQIAKTKDRELLLQLKNGFTRSMDLKTRIEKIKLRQKQADQKSKSEIASFCERYNVPQLDAEGLPDLTRLEVRLEDLKSQIKTHHQTQRELNIQSELARYVAQLATGEACPLCGSPDHPAPAHIESVQGQIEIVSDQIRSLEKEIKNFEAGQVEWGSLKRNMAQLEENRRQENEELSQLQLSRKELEDFFHPHLDQYPDHTVIQSALEETDRVLSLIKTLEERLREYRKSHQENSAKLESYRTEIEKIKHSAHSKRGELTSVEAHFSEQLRSELARHSSEEWEQRSVSIGKQVEKEKAEFRAVVAERDRISQEYTQLKTNLENANAYREKELGQLREAEQQLGLTMEKSSFETIESVREILRLEIDVDAEQDRIVKYDRDVHVLEVSLRELKVQIGDQKFDLQMHEETIERCAGKEKELEKIREHVAYQTKRIEDLQKRLGEKKNLEKESDTLRLRAENLKVLEGLFKGKKFVDYVSTIYLREICEIANRRFRKLTNNHYALVLGEDNQFNVRDFLHDGQIRSVKTLSGGQVFQVSLCLALALAESIQSRNQTRQNFFFLDEGFGTLDGDALRMVMETLKSLRQEGRVVGLISHVESMQQEMDMYLHIVNDPENGSQIRKSY